MYLPTSLKPDEGSLQMELDVFRNHVSYSKPYITTIFDAFAYCLQNRNIFPLTLRCLQLALTAPVTSAASERSFSKLNLVKNLIRSTMGQERLQSLLILACERDLTDVIDLGDVTMKWANLARSGRLIRLLRKELD